MKTNILSLLAIAGLLTFASCANDDTANKDNNDQEPGTEGLTSFVEEDQTTRTTGEYDGSGLNFYWTEDDRLWVNTGTALAPVLTQDSKNNINSTLVNNPANPSAVKRVDKAKFYFAGTFTASSYPVRYTGKNGAKDKVTIKAAQSQTVPNDASHIGEDGDFGVATATKPAGGDKYHFTLDHKAAYITFMPYTTQGVVAGAKIQKIRVFTGNTSDALAGTFDLADNGTLSNPAATSNSVTLTVPNFSIPNTETYATNAATMVVNPGTYNNVSIEYTLHDPVTYVTGTITKTYPSVTFTAGRNKKVHTDLQVTEYPSDDYYMWDAALNQHYWAGHTSEQPKTNHKSGDPTPTGYPQNNSDSRWYNEVQGYSDVTGASPAVKAEHSCKDCPNINELLWYVHKDYGDPHWDATSFGLPWVIYIKVVCGSKRKPLLVAVLIPIRHPTEETIRSLQATLVSINRPQHCHRAAQQPFRLLLPSALGRYYSGSLNAVGWDGLYWSSTPYPFDTGFAYDLFFSSGFVNIGNGYIHSRDYGLRRWVAE
ncbi:hypothetical protein [Hoylesella enoeca]|uniref:hypothetical protein n=1 Tax=Hoylesella enoeca TaxID=76123 RepID=UPI0006877621|nr:hypothetical protein [Hoylesella enoeca]